MYIALWRRFFVQTSFNIERSQAFVFNTWDVAFFFGNITGRMNYGQSLKAGKMKKSKSFIIVVNNAPMSAGVNSALNFAKAILALGHELTQVFFMKDGVYCCSSLLTPMSDEINIYQQWKTLSESKGVILNVCVASALRRGIITEQEAKNNNHAQYNLIAPFNLVGLGQLVKDFDCSHQIIQFGN